MLPNPNYVGDNPTARHRYTLRTVAPPTVPVNASPATYVLCHWRMLPPRTETVLRCALLVYNMGNIPLRPAGPIHSSRRNWRLRKSLRDEPISIRHLHSTQTESYLGIREDAGGTAHLPLGPQESHDFSRRGLPSSRRRRVQRRHPVAPCASCVLAQACSKAPITLFRNLDLTFLGGPDSESS